jgi:toxin ParE1/3/4
MSVKLSAAAQLDLFQIATEGLERFGPHQVARYEAGLQKAFDLLARNPKIASEHSEYTPPVWIYPFQAHVIIYFIVEEDIFIVRVCHSRDDWTRFT